jgi:dTDP-4-dehydrorhamnose 3,5-epimerase
LFIPSGFAHGFVVLSDGATFTYKVDNYYALEHERGIAFDDADLRIDWHLPLEELLLSDKDKKYPNLSDAVDIFE